MVEKKYFARFVIKLATSDENGVTNNNFLEDLYVNFAVGKFDCTCMEDQL